TSSSLVSSSSLMICSSAASLVASFASRTAFRLALAVLLISGSNCKEPAEVPSINTNNNTK
ncbi:hypothetical protein A2U01_0112861, partial [Trifolium medium]|nr:hypothetical protein [Trifolium medium]